MTNVLRFDKVGIGEIASVGGKSASLGEMVKGARWRRHSNSRRTGAAAATGDNLTFYYLENLLSCQ